MKNRKQIQQERAINFLQENFYVTDAELVAKHVNPLWVTPDDVAEKLQVEYGVHFPQQKHSYSNWGEFIQRLSCVIANLRVEKF